MDCIAYDETYFVACGVQGFIQRQIVIRGQTGHALIVEILKKLADSSKPVKFPTLIPGLLIIKCQIAQNVTKTIT